MSNHDARGKKAVEGESTANRQTCPQCDGPLSGIEARGPATHVAHPCGCPVTAATTRDLVGERRVATDGGRMLDDHEGCECGRQVSRSWSYCPDCGVALSEDDEDLIADGSGVDVTVYYVRGANRGLDRGLHLTSDCRHLDDVEASRIRGLPLQHAPRGSLCNTCAPGVSIDDVERDGIPDRITADGVAELTPDTTLFYARGNRGNGGQDRGLHLSRDCPHLKRAKNVNDCTARTAPRGSICNYCGEDLTLEDLLGDDHPSVAADGGVRPPDLTQFQIDLLGQIHSLEGTGVDVYGLAIKESLEDYYEQEVHHGRLYPNLDDLVAKGLVEKSELDRRSNEYHLTEVGRRVLEERHDVLEGWLRIDRDRTERPAVADGGGADGD